MADEERTVQVPVSQIANELEYRVRTAVARWRAADRDGRDGKAVVDAEVRGGRAAILALLSQPTPTTEHKLDCDRASELSTRCDCHVGQAAISETFRSEEVVPDARESLCPRCGGSGCVGLADCRVCSGTGIDPSTIRDVTPPKGA